MGRDRRYWRQGWIVYYFYLLSLPIFLIDKLSLLWRRGEIENIGDKNNIKPFLIFDFIQTEKKLITKQN
jgi:hypothetical protein